MLPSALTVDSLADLLMMSRLYKVSKALNAAAKLDLFSALARHAQGATVGQVSVELGLCTAPSFRGACDWLDLLVSVRILERTGSGDAALYSNSPLAAKHLVRGSSHYAGGILALNNDRSYVMWEYLEQALRHGQLPEEAFRRVPSILDTFGSDKAAAEFFAEGMTGASLGSFQALAASVDFGRFSSLGDLDGSAGCLSCCVAARHPHMTCTTYDLPPVHEAAERYVAAAGCAGRVKVADLDFFSDSPLPYGHDVLTFSMVLHDWGLDKKLNLMAKAYDALPPGGALIAIDNLIDDERRSSAVQLGMSLTMLLEFGSENSFDYSFKEFSAWAQQVGFSSSQLVDLHGTAKAAIAYK